MSDKNDKTKDESGLVVPEDGGLELESGAIPELGVADSNTDSQANPPPKRRPPKKPPPKKSLPVKKNARYAERSFQSVILMPHDFTWVRSVSRHY